MSTSLVFDLIARDRASSKFDDVGDSASKSSDKLKRWAKVGAAALGVGAVAAGKFALDAVGAASEVEQSYGALESVYGRNADRVKRWAESAAGSVGLAKSEYANLSALVGSQLQGMGVASEESAKKSNDLIQLGSDLAATYGGTVKEAVEAVSSTLKGETDPIERYGVSIKASDISARLAAEGLDELEGKAKKQATAQAVLAMLTEQTGKAQGAFGRESETLAGKQERLRANFENLKATLGEKLLPVATDVTGAVGDFVSELQTGEGVGGRVADVFTTISDNLDTIGPILGVVTAGFVAYKAATMAAAAASAIQAAGTTAATGATWSLNAALRANPILAVVSLLTLLGGGLVLAYKKSETFRAIVDKSFSVVASAGKAMWNNVLKPAFSAMKDGFKAVGEAGRWLWNNALQPAFKFIVGGVANLMDMWARMLGALSKVPGFGWAKKASDAMATAADKAREMADGIKKIPSSKTVSVTVAYRYTGLRNGSGPTRGRGDDFLGRVAAGDRDVLPTLERRVGDAYDVMSRAADKGTEKITDKVRRRFDRFVENTRTRWETLASDIKNLSSSVAGSFNESLLGDATTGGDLVSALGARGSSLTALLDQFRQLQATLGGKGRAFLSALFQSGNTDLIASLASGPASTVTAAAQLFGNNAALADQLGDRVAVNEYGPKAKAQMDRIEKALEDAPKKYAKELKAVLRDIRIEVKGGSPGRQAHVRGAW